MSVGVSESKRGGMRGGIIPVGNFSYLVTLLSSSSKMSSPVVLMFSFTTMIPLILPSSYVLSTDWHFSPSRISIPH